MAHYDKMLQVQQENIKINIENSIQAVEELFYSGKKLTIRDIAKKAGVSTNFLYAHSEITDKINYYKKINKADITTEKINLLLAENKRLTERIVKYSQLIEKQFINNRGDV